MGKDYLAHCKKTDCHDKASAMASLDEFRISKLFWTFDGTMLVVS